MEMTITIIYCYCITLGVRRHKICLEIREALLAKRDQVQLFNSEHIVFVEEVLLAIQQLSEMGNTYDVLL